MTSTASWSDLTGLIDRLLDTPPEKRDALILEMSAGDPRRRAELEQLLAECSSESSVVSGSAVERFQHLFDDEPTRFPETLSNRYRVAKELGRGGMATVFLARDLKHSRDVAVKVMHPSIAAALGADLFLREIEIAAQLRHPHIVPLFDSGDADGALYYVMPFEEGASLRERLEDVGALPIDDVVVILRDVCDALAHAHAHGVVHRDIKPDNVMLSGRHAMVTDFGVATAATAATPSAAPALGTPAYMAPEQITGHTPVDRRADIYSVGVLAYELLTGHTPFEGSRETVLDAQQHRQPAPLATQRSDIPPALDDLVMTCLEKDPEARWQSADEIVSGLEEIGRSDGGPSTSASNRLRTAIILAGAIAAVVLLAIFWRPFASSDASWRDRWTNARVERITDFPGSEVDAAISADGQNVAFLADRDSSFDAFVTQVGSDGFLNLTNGHFPQLFNEDVRNIGFDGDGKRVWVRIADIVAPASVWTLPVAGGAVTPFLRTAVMVVWSPDKTRIAYHETVPGDPIFVANPDGSNPRKIYSAEPGVHSHYLAWSPDGRFLYFSHGLPPDEMDIWRIRPDGKGVAEQITHHNSRVGYPLPLDDRTLFYTATAADGNGPWLYSMDLKDRTPRRVSTAVEHYLSISASAEIPGKNRRLVATVSNPGVHLWSVPITTAIAGEKEVKPLGVPTARSAAPRFARDSSVFYLGSLGGGDGVWRSASGTARQLWKSPTGAVVAPPAVSPNGERVCFPVKRDARTTLHCMNADGTREGTIAGSLDVRGPASWSPDGKWLAIAAREGLRVRLFMIPAAGGNPTRLVDSVSSNPVWSPDGKFILYSGTPRARSVPLKAVTPDGRPYAVPALSVDRLGDSYRFLPDGKLMVKLGGFRRQDFWLLDLASGARRQLTALKPGQSLQRFDVSPDGKRILFERVEENSDVVLIELPPLKTR